ncbi:MAG: hypothetical protein ACLR2G_11690 [Phascolarctobacterium faecium]
MHLKTTTVYFEHTEENNDQLLADIQIFLQRQKEETAALQTASAQLAAAKLQLQQAQELHNAFAEATAARTAFLTLTEQRSAVETAKTEAAQADKAALLEEIYNSTLRAHKHNQECLSAEQRSAGNNSGASKAAGTAPKASEQLQQLDGQSTAISRTDSAGALNQRILQLHSGR